MNDDERELVENLKRMTLHGPVPLSTTFKLIEIIDRLDGELSINKQTTGEN